MGDKVSGNDYLLFRQYELLKDVHWTLYLLENRYRSVGSAIGETLNATEAIN
jgi:hypothetical protein